MKISLDKYLLYSSVFSIFTEAFLVKFIIDWKLLYLIIFLNYAILIRIKKITFNIYFVGILLFFFIHGLLSYTIIGIPYNYMLSQIIGIGIVGTYFYNFIPLYDRKRIITVYLNITFYVAVIGYILFFLNINLNDERRLQSIFTEPAHYAIVVVPACYYYLRRKKYLRFLTIFGTLILSNSSLGYIGCALMFILPNLSVRRVKYLLMLVPVIILVFSYLYEEHPFFRLRVDDTVESLDAVRTGKFDQYTNLSSFVLLGNMYIANRNIQDHPLGSGIGSHHAMHQRYIKEVRVPEYIRINDKVNDNSFDACSLFTRMTSEFGLFAFIFAFLAVLYFSQSFLSDKLFFAQGIFIYVLLKLFRDGHYFPPEMYFFIWLIFFELRDYFRQKKDVSITSNCEDRS